MFSVTVLDTAIYQREHPEKHERIVDMQKKEKDGDRHFVEPHSRMIVLIIPGVSQHGTSKRYWRGLTG